MKINFKKIILVLLVSNLFNGCQSIKDGLEGNKKSKSAEEFLIQKKNPLVLPPDYSKLPLPKNEANNESNKDFDLKKKLEKNLDISKNNSNKKVTDSFEQTIIEKIRKN